LSETLFRQGLVPLLAVLLYGTGLFLVAWAVEHRRIALHASWKQWRFSDY
jgi:hypothetical protein